MSDSSPVIFMELFIVFGRGGSTVIRYGEGGKGGVQLLESEEGGWGWMRRIGRGERGGSLLRSEEDVLCRAVGADWVLISGASISAEQSVPSHQPLCSYSISAKPPQSPRLGFQSSPSESETHTPEFPLTGNYRSLTGKK